MGLGNSTEAKEIAGAKALQCKFLCLKDSREAHMAAVD